MRPLRNLILLWLGFTVFIVAAVVFPPLIFIVPGIVLCLFLMSAYGDAVSRGSIEKLNSLSSIQRVYIFGLGAGNTRFRATWELEKLAEQEKDPVQREAIAKFIRRVVSLQMLWARIRPKDEPWKTDDVGNFLPALAAVQPPWESALLEQIARSRLTIYSRGQALERLAKLRGVDALDYLLQRLEDPSLATPAVRAIASLGPAAATRYCVECLQRLVAQSKDTWTISAAANAFIAIGHGNNAVLQENKRKLVPWKRFAVRLKADGVSAAALIERLFESGVIAADRRQEVKSGTHRRLQTLLDRGDDYLAVHGLLIKLRSVHDVESKCADRFELFPDYLKALGKAVAPRLMFKDVTFTSGEFRFDVCDATIRLKRDSGWDWFDVLEAIDLVLFHSGRQERLALLDGDIGHVVLGRADGLIRLIDDLELPIWFRPNAPLSNNIEAYPEDHFLRAWLRECASPR